MLHNVNGTVRGIIPACAGKSGNVDQGLNKGEDHPRVRGEKALSKYADVKTLGSSPRARGKGSPSADEMPSLRIIPACAGKRVALTAPLRLDQDHPRVRGEKNLCRGLLFGGEGSSPRARGKALLLVQRTKLFGIIPACAGKSSRFRY